MTFIGKIFVMLNLVISIMMAAIGMGLYTSGIDWTEKAAKGTDPAGLTALRKAELKAAQDAVPAVEAGYAVANEELMKREEDRQADQAWYAGELVHVRSQATAENPARDIDIQDNGVPKQDLKMPRRPLRIAAEDRAKKPLMAIAAYDGLLKKAQAENDTLLGQLAKEFDADILLTVKLTPPKGEKGGLRDRIVDERLKREGIKDETDAVAHLATKGYVESAVVGERIEMLDKQITALRRAVSRLGGMDGKK